MKHVFFLTALLSVMGGSMGHAQNNIYTHVEQNSTSLEDRLGTAAFSLYGYISAKILSLPDGCSKRGFVVKQC